MTLVETETRPEARPGLRIEDVEYQRQGGHSMLARIYRPAGTGPYPAVIQVHGGAWVNKDRTDNDFIAKALAESGILVASIDFRMPPEAPYPGSLADINLATRWLKARARTYGGRPDWVGTMGTSSGGHQVLLAALRPTDARYAALPLADAPQTDARVAFVISGWGVLDPLLRYHLAKKAGNAELIENHHAFWGDEAAMSEGSVPAILDRGEKTDLPPALIFGGDADEWVPVETMHRTVNGWKKAGGEVELQLYPGANHGFMTGKPNAPYAAPAIDRMKAFIRKHTG
ncbi:MAG TPA: alpha/beta hydrolase [Stellaceae bacterium]|jgi:acetyl esterase/lipase|nr:alpha/beta hydrolase [Stellaceae bacterium]